jgi:ABC-type antimicrobial peptide transport system permease subunit
MALGATSRAVMTMVLRDGAGLAACGVLAGVPAALIAGRLVASQLFQVAPHDPLAIAVASLTISMVALVAAWLPARRAARANPLAALREG